MPRSRRSASDTWFLSTSLDAYVELRRGLAFLPCTAWLTDGEDPYERRERPSWHEPDYAAFPLATLEDVLDEVERASRRATSPSIIAGCETPEHRVDSRLALVASRSGVKASIEKQLSPEAVLILRRRAFGWQYELLLVVWNDLVADQRSTVSLEASPLADCAPANDPIVWIAGQVSEFTRILGEFARLVGVTIPNAIGDLSEDTDPTELIAAAKQIVRLREVAILWQRRCRSTLLRRPFDSLRQPLELVAKSMIDELTTFPTRERDSISSLLRDCAEQGRPVQGDFKLRVEINSLQKLLDLYTRAILAEALAANS